MIHAVWPFVVWFTENIFREDKEIVEYEQRAYDAQGADWNNEVFPAIRDLRGVLARCGKPMDVRRYCCTGWAAAALRAAAAAAPGVPDTS